MGRKLNQHGFTQYRRICRRVVCVCGLVVAAAVLPADVQACPMCKTATETSGEKSQPAAYMASILTMLGMPAMLFTVLGVSMYRISRSESAQLGELADDPSERPDLPRS